MMNYIKYNIIYNSIPQGVKKYLFQIRTTSSRMPYTLAYWMVKNTQLHFQKKIDLLPALANPKVYWVALKKVEYQGLIRNQKGKLSCPGDWDINLIYPYISVFESVPENAKCWDIHETIRTIFLYKKDYQETPQFKSMVTCLNENKLSRHFKVLHSLKDIHKYFERLQAAYNSIKRNGFLTQREQGKLDDYEIEIFVTREGKLAIGRGGNHRIRMAELLGCHEIPIIIKGIHPFFIEKLIHSYSLPPRKAVEKWLNTEFATERKAPGSIVRKPILQ